MYSCFQRGVRLFPGNRCMGTRVWVTEEQKDAADAPKYKLEDKAPMRGEYVWETYAEIDEAARDLGAGLVALGYPHHTNVGIFSANRVEWMVGALGLYSQNMRVVSLYPSLGENAVEFIINHAEVPVVLVSKQNLPALLKSLPNMKASGHTALPPPTHDCRWTQLRARRLGSYCMSALPSFVGVYASLVLLLLSDRT